MKIALVHDHLTQRGGAEAVLQVFQDIFPKAPIFTLIYDKEKMGNDFDEANIKSSFIQRSPQATNFFKWYLPLMPLATESYNLNDYDVILSNSSAFAKGVITKPDTLHICYCHTPTRYLWTDSHLYIRELPYNGLVKKAISLFLPRLRLWDRAAAGRVDKFIANSKTVQKRISKYYDANSDVIYPPIDVSKFKIFPKQKKYFLAGGRLVAYKRFDLIVEAFNRLNIPLKIFGIGPELEKLKKMAKSNIEFLGKVTNEKRAELYGECQAFIHPQEEDFGLMVLEAMASGRPVIAYNKGGALETVVEGKTGEFFDVQGWEILAHKIINFKSEKYNPEEIRNHAKNFDVIEFKERIKSMVQSNWQDFQAKP